MIKSLLISILLAIICIFCVDTVRAQMMYDFSDDGFIRIAERGQLADTINVWGDLGRTGRYLVPRGTRITELVSFTGGPQASRGAGNNPWARIRLRIHLAKYNAETGREEVQSFQFRYQDPIPAELRNYNLSNNEIITVEVKRRPAFIDVLGVVGPILGTVVTSIYLYERLTD